MIKEPGMFKRRSKNGYGLTVKGIEQKTLVYGEKTLMTEFLLRKKQLAASAYSPSRADRISCERPNSSFDRTGRI